MNAPTTPLYVVSLEEILWGALLTAVTMMIHGFGMILTLKMHNAFKSLRERILGSAIGFGSLILASWMILLVHLIEVQVWAEFFTWQQAMPNRSVAFYFSLNEYTTLGSTYDLPQQWRLLEGMIATSGLLGFAWSTGTLMTLAREFQDHHLRIRDRDPESR